MSMRRTRTCSPPTLDGLVTALVCSGRLGEVAAGAVLKHSRDRDLTRESVLASDLSAETPAFDVPQACATGLQKHGPDREQDRARADRLRHRVRSRHHVRRAARSERAAAPDASAGEPRASAPGRSGRSQGPPAHLMPAIPRNEEPRTGLSMGEHCALMAEPWGSAVPSRTNSPPQPSTRRLLRAGLQEDLLSTASWAWRAMRTCAPNPRSSAWPGCSLRSAGRRDA